jgi:hypothetical protein
LSGKGRQQSQFAWGEGQRNAYLFNAEQPRQKPKSHIAMQLLENIHGFTIPGKRYRPRQPPRLGAAGFEELEHESKPWNASVTDLRVLRFARGRQTDVAKTQVAAQCGGPQLGSP